MSAVLVRGLAAGEADDAVFGHSPKTSQASLCLSSVLSHEWHVSRGRPAVREKALAGARQLFLSPTRCASSGVLSACLEASVRAMSTGGKATSLDKHTIHSEEAEKLKHVKSDLDALEDEWAHLQAEARVMRRQLSEPNGTAAVPPPLVPAGGQQSDSGEGEEKQQPAWPEPTLADLDRSIPQVDCEFIANLIRSRNLRRDSFLKRKAEIKARVEELTRQTTRSVKEAAELRRLGGLNAWRSGVASLLGEEEETALAASSKESPVLASEEVLAQLTPEELDVLQTTRPEYDDGFILLDCRTVNEVTSWGIIEGAKVLPAHELFEAFHATPEDFLAEYGFPKPRPEDIILCYCQYGPRSLMAAQLLSWMGYLKVLHFRDGYYEWGKQFNLLLRRWMEHDKTSGNELRRLATFRAALELQREIAPEFNALPMQEAAKYQIDTTRSRGTLRIGDGLRAEAYQAVAKLIEALPETRALPGHLEDAEQDKRLRRDQHLTQFLEQTTGVNPLAEEDPSGGFSLGEAQSRAIKALTDCEGATGSKGER